MQEFSVLMMKPMLVQVNKREAYALGDASNTIG